MTWSEHTVSGFALAAAIADDAGAARARPGLHEAVAEEACRVAVQLQALDSARRRRRLGAIAAGLRPRAQLEATDLVTAPRPGFAPSTELLALMRRARDVEEGSWDA